MENQTQSRDQDVVTFSTFTGLRNDVTPERFTPGDLDYARNVNIDKSGKVSRRDGYTRVNNAVGPHSLWANRQGTEAFFAANNVLYRLNADYTSAPIAALKSNARIDFTAVNGRTYFSNGVDTGVIEQGAVRSWGVAPPSLPNVSIGVGNMPAGTYQFTTTFMMSDGQESGAQLGATVQVPQDGAGLTFTDMPMTSDPRVVATNLYLTVPNGEIMHLALTVPIGVNSAEYTNDATELTLPLESQFRQAAPPGQLVAYYRGRVFVAQDDVIFPSDDYAYERFDLRRFIPTDGRVTMMAEMYDRELYDAGKSSGLFIGTDKSCGVLVGASPEDFQYVPKASYGAVFGAVTMVDGTLVQDGSAGMRELPMFLTDGGVCVGMPNLEIKNLTRSRYGFPTGNQGAALFMSGPNRFLATSKTTT